MSYLKTFPLLKFTSRCCLFTKFLCRHELWTLFGGILSKTASTLPLEMFSTMKYSTVKMLWSRPGNHNNTLFLELVNCKSLPVSSMGRPPGKTCIFSSKVFRPSWTTATSSQESTWIWYTHLQPSKKLMPFFWRLRRHLTVIQKMLTFGTKLLVIFRASRESHEDFDVWSIFVLLSLITNNPPSKTSAGWTCLRTWQIWTTLVLARTSKQASRVNRTYPTLEPSNPPVVQPLESFKNQKKSHLRPFLSEQKIGVDPKCFHPDSTTGLSKSITETHNKESTCEEASWPAIFKKRAFLTLNSGLQSTCLTDRREMDPIWTACRLRNSQSIGRSKRNLESGNLLFLKNDLKRIY